MRHITIFRDPAVYASHTSVCQAANCDVLAAFRQAPFEHVFAHVHPMATVGLARSRDGGQTWEPPSTVFDPGDDINVNDPSLTTLSDGTIILTAFTLPCPRAGHESAYGERARPVRGNTYLYVPGEQPIFLLRSFDHGETWDGPFEVDVSAYGKDGGGVFGSVVELEDGTLLMPITARRAESRTSAAALLASRDAGKSWEPYSAITTWSDGEPVFGLPSVVALDDGSMVAAGWAGVESALFVARSEDAGITWSSPVDVGARGACAHLCLTSSGTVLMSFGHRDPPFGIRVFPSADGGRSWDVRQVRELRADGAMRDLGYPWTAQLANDSLLCAYYFNVHDVDKSYYDEAASRAICEQWKLDPELYTYRTAGLRFIAGTLLDEHELAAMPTVISTSAQTDGPTLI